MFRVSKHLREVQLRHLQVLDAISERGSFWAASELLDCSPAAVSQQLATLEKIVGHRLVERSRGRRQVGLTEAGRLLVRHAQAIVARLRAAEADFATFDRGAAGTLRVGTYQSVGAKILPTVLRQFASEWPGVEVILTEGANDDLLLQMIERGQLDLTIAGLPLPEGPFAGVRLMEDPYVLLVPQDSPLAHPDPEASDVDVTDLRLISLCQGPIVTAVENHFRGLGITPRIVFRTEDNSTMQGLVAAGFGAALTPLLTVDEKDAAVAIVPLDSSPSRILALAWHRDRYRSPAADAFVATARAVCARLQERSVTDPGRPYPPPQLADGGRSSGAHWLPRVPAGK